MAVLKLAAGGGAAVVSIYDSIGSDSPTGLVWVLDASTTDVDCQVFANPLAFTKGVYAVCDQGWDFNPVVCIAKVTPR